MSAGRRILLYCTKADLLELLGAAEQKARLKYLQAGAHPSRDAACRPIATCSEIPRLGESSHGDRHLDVAYLLFPQEAAPQAREVSLNEGGTVWMMDSLLNPDTVRLCPGGLYDGRVLVPGEFSSVGKREFPNRLIGLLRSQLRKRARAVSGHWIGGDAERLWKLGLRLTEFPKASAKYDLSE